MPLSAAAPRRHLHTRQIECRGFERDDGLWEVEGHMTDVKTYTFNNTSRGELQPGDPIHEMWIRMTYDDGMVIRAIEAVTDNSPFGLCGGITPSYQALVGLKIGPGFTRKLKELLGGAAGCTHLTELMGPIATTAFQTMASKRWRDPPLSEGPRRRPWLIGTCHAFAPDGEIVRERWPEYYERKAEAKG